MVILLVFNFGNMYIKIKVKDGNFKKKGPMKAIYEKEWKKK